MASKTNLWAEILRESSKRSKYPPSTIIFAGDVGCGKTSLVDKLCSENGSTIQAEKSAAKSSSRMEILSYNYFNVDDGSIDSESALRVNLWSVSNNTFENAFEVIYRPSLTSQESPDRLLLMIGLDLSQGDECIKTLKRWLQKVQVYCTHYHASIGDKLSAKIKSSTMAHIRTARAIRGAASQVEDTNEAFDGSAPNSSSSSIAAFGVPILVVGCKSDKVVSDTAVALKASQELQGQLRSLCLQVGASLIYTSATSPDNAKTASMARFKKYVHHRLYPESISACPLPLQIDDALDGVFVPAGFDTVELIASSTGVADSAVQSFEEWFSVPASSGQVGNSPTGVIQEIESEQDWLLGLNNYVLQATNSMTSLQTAPSTTPTSGPIATSAAITSAIPPAAPTTRRSTRATSATQQKKEDVDDFFKSLLTSKK